MSAWSDYLREQAVIADRVAANAVTADSRREFEEIAASYRRDADAEERMPSDGSMPSLVEVPPRRKSSVARAAF